MGIQKNLSQNDQKTNIASKLADMDELVKNADASAQQTTVSYDTIYKGKAGSIAFMFQNDVMKDYTTANMQKAKELTGVDNVLVVDKSGKVIAGAKKSPATFTYSRFNQLKEVFETGEPSDGFNVSNGDENFRYYSAKIDDNHMVVVEENVDELDHFLENTATWESILSNISVGIDGFAFAISAKDYTFLYYPDETLVGQDALTSGVSVEHLETGDYAWMTINGQRLYCGTTMVDDAYILCAVTEDEILSSNNTTVALVLFAFFVVITLVITYAFFIMQEDSGSHMRPIFGQWALNTKVFRKVLTVSVAGLVCITLVSYYMQTLFALSRYSMKNNQRVTEVERDLNFYAGESDKVMEEYNQYYLNKAEIAAYIMSENPKLAEREKLAELSKILDVESINIFDAEGVQTATNSPYTKFELSEDPKDQSYEFRKLLLGVESLIQEPRTDDVSGELRQYIGVKMCDENEVPVGLVQISVEPSKLADTIANMKIDKILSSIQVGNNGSVFAINKANNKFAYFTNKKLIGKDAMEHGLKETQMVDGYSGYLTINNQKYWGSCLETDDYYVYSMVPKNSIGNNTLPVTAVTVCASMVALIIVIFLLCLNKREEKPEESENLDSAPTEDEKTDHSVMIDVTMPDGRKTKTEEVAHRWENTFINWREKTPEQKMMTVLKGFWVVFAVLICLAVLMQDSIFDENSVVRHVISGRWAKGVNVFALTASLLIVCVASVVTMIIQRGLAMLANISSAKGETICRLLQNFVKYISVLAMLYYCLALFGVNTATLLASAGILSLIIGLGAQTLVSDILAGLFIIFEGEFHVGDIVTIGDYRGTVVEIGIRTTKIQDGSKNIKIISNSSVTGVVNMTKEHSFTWVDVGIEYGESLERVENILEKEFPNIRENLPDIIDGPFYKGVVSLGDNSVNLRVMVLCEEGNRVQMERDLNREMKLIFDKYDINIPFPQVVVNQPIEFQKATELEKMQARQFTKSQRELSGKFVEDDDDDK